jgi:mannose-6-phosphate isomerase-like protein (cupin superfamily)
MGSISPFARLCIGAAASGLWFGVAVAHAGQSTEPALVDAATARADDPTTHISGPQVQAAFAKGAPLQETPTFKIHASRRTESGQAEVHVDDTDIIYVLEGSATFVTGGILVGGSETAPGEIRGKAIEGGTSREVKPSDVLVVPNGTPHWFQSVEGPVLYYVVKVPGALPR